MLLNVKNCKERIISELKNYDFKYIVNNDDIIVRLNDNSSCDYVISIDIPRNKLFRTRKRYEILNMFKNYDILSSVVPVVSQLASGYNFDYCPNDIYDDFIFPPKAYNSSKPKSKYKLRIMNPLETLENEVKEFQTVEELMVDLKSFKVQLEV